MRLIGLLILLLAAALALSVAFGETVLSLGQYQAALTDPTSPPGVILFAIRGRGRPAPRWSGRRSGSRGR